MTNLKISLISFSMAVGLAGNATVLVVDKNNPLSSDGNPGTAEKPLKTISAAAKLANPGDTVLVHRGIYRERVTPARGGEEGKPIVYQAANGEEVVIRGSEIWKPDWKKLGENVFSAGFEDAIFKNRNPFLIRVFSDENYGKKPEKMPAFRPCTGQIFVDGAMLNERADEKKVIEEPGTWTVSPAKDCVIVHFPDKVKDIAGALVEVSVRERIFAPHIRGLGYIHVRGFIMEHCANIGFLPEPQTGALSPRSGHDWVIEGNTIRFAKTIGLDCGSEGWVKELFTDIEEQDRKIIIGGKHLVKGNTFSDNGLCGIAGWNHKGTKVIGNVVERNNSLGFHIEEEMAGMKFHCSDVLVEGNLVRDNNAWGIWIDNQNNGARVTRNVIIGNAMGGLFVELLDGPALFDNNIIAFSKPFAAKSQGSGSGYGIYTHDASGAVFANNLVLQTSDFGILMRTITPRKIKDKLVETSNQRIINSIVVNDRLISLPYPNQRSKDNVSDFNLFSPCRKNLAPCFGINWYSIPKEMKEKIEKNENPKPDWSNIGLDDWRRFMGLDAKSLIDKSLKAELDPKSMTLKITVASAKDIPACKTAAGVDIDFNGTPYPADCIPGPFQNLKEGTNEFKIWPVNGRPAEKGIR